VVEVQSTPVPFVVPNLIVVAVVPRPNPVPVTVTVIPPDVGPVFGLTLVTVGVNLKRSAVAMALVPFGVVTVTFTIPALSAAEVAVIAVEELTVKLVALVEPNLTAVTPLKLVPVMVTTVPPATGPLVGLTFVTVGAGPGGTYVNPSAELVELVPPGVVTVTCTVPAASGGDVAVIAVAELTVKLVAFVEPNLTAVAPVKFVPVIVTEVPPASRPAFGLTPVTVGSER